MLQNTMAGGLGEIHHVLCVNSSSKYPQSEMGACLTRSDYKESHSTMKDCREPSRSLVAPLLLLNPDWGDFVLSLCICWSFTSPLSSSFFRIMEENMKCCVNVWQFHKNVSTRGVKFHRYEFIPVVVSMKFKLR